jgi:hypothetical protein
MTLSLRPLQLGAIKPEGWLLEQITCDLESGFAGRLDQLTAHAANDLFRHRIASSQEQVAWWDAETRGNWLWGYVMLAHLAGHPAHVARVRSLVEALRDTQDADGYIGIYAPGSRYSHPDGENGELWAQSRALLMLLAYAELSSDSSYQRAVERAVHLTMRQYGDSRRYFRQADNPTALLTGLTHGLCYIDVLDWLHRRTGDPAYRDFGLWLFADFNQMRVPFANDDMALANLLDPYRPFSGHAVHTAEHLRCLIWAAAESREMTLQEALRGALGKLERYLLPSGALIGDESIHGMPTPDIGYEYCTLTELLVSTCAALEKLGDPTFADRAERIAFNAGQGARMADGRAIAYLSSDAQLTATHRRPDSYSYLHDLAGRFKYSPTHEDIACCCNPNAVRFMPHYISRMWMRHPQGIAAMLYGPCHLTTAVDGVGVQIAEDTRYPFSDRITFAVSTEQDVTFTLMLRKPGWSREVTVEAQGARIREQEGYVAIEKRWTTGDAISIGFAPEITLKPYPSGEYSVHYGALQFVLPIAHRLRPIKGYPLPTFHDYDVVPLDIEAAYQTTMLDASRPSYGLVPERIESGPEGLWEHPPIRLRGAKGIILVPMGSTVLRRAAFPLRTEPREGAEQ